MILDVFCNFKIVFNVNQFRKTTYTSAQNIVRFLCEGIFVKQFSFKNEPRLSDFFKRSRFTDFFNIVFYFVVKIVQQIPFVVCFEGFFPSVFLNEFSVFFILIRTNCVKFATFCNKLIAIIVRISVFINLLPRNVTI